jgi:hypothetical protein
MRESAPQARPNLETLRDLAERAPEWMTDKEERAFHDAANPAVIISLLDRLEAAEQALEAVRARDDAELRWGDPGFEEAVERARAARKQRLKDWRCGQGFAEEAHEYVGGRTISTIPGQCWCRERPIDEP